MQGKRMESARKARERGEIHEGQELLLSRVTGSLHSPCAFLHLHFDLASCMTNSYRYHLFLARDPS